MNTLKKSLKEQKYIGIYFRSWCSNFINNDYNIELTDENGNSVRYSIYKMTD